MDRVAKQPFERQGDERGNPDGNAKARPDGCPAMLDDLSRGGHRTGAAHIDGKPHHKGTTDRTDDNQWRGNHKICPINAASPYTMMSVGFYNRIDAKRNGQLWGGVRAIA